jgi:hypothetical protein
MPICLTIIKFQVLLGIRLIGNDGYTQAKIAKFIGMFRSLLSKIVNQRLILLKDKDAKDKEDFTL